MTTDSVKPEISNPMKSEPRQVLYIDLRDRNEKSEKPSALVKDLRAMERSGSLIAERIAQATVKGIRRYRKERGRAYKSDSGSSISRIPLHASRGLSKGLEELEGIAEEAERGLGARHLRARVSKRS